MGFITSRCCCAADPADFYALYTTPQIGIPTAANVIRFPVAYHAGFADYILPGPWRVPFQPIAVGNDFGLPRIMRTCRQSGDRKLFGITDVRSTTLGSAVSGSNLGTGYFVADVASFDNPTLQHFVRLTPSTEVNELLQSLLTSNEAYDSISGSWVHKGVLVNGNFGPGSGTAIDHRYIEYGGNTIGKRIDHFPNGWNFTGYKFLRAAKRSTKAIGFKCDITRQANNVPAFATYTLAIGDASPPFDVITNPSDLFSFTLTNGTGQATPGLLITMALPNVIDFDVGDSGQNPAWIIGIPQGGTIGADIANYEIRYSANIRPTSQSTTRLFTFPTNIRIARPAETQPMRVWSLNAGGTITLRSSQPITSTTPTISEVVLEYRSGGTVQWSRFGRASLSTGGARYNFPVALTVRNDEWFYIRDFFMYVTDATREQDWTAPPTYFESRSWVGNVGGDVLVDFYKSNQPRTIEPLPIRINEFPTPIETHFFNDAVRTQDEMAPTQEWLEQPGRTTN